MALIQIEESALDSLKRMVEELEKDAARGKNLEDAVKYFMRAIENHAHMDNLRGGAMGSAWDKLHAAMSKE